MLLNFAVDVSRGEKCCFSTLLSLLLPSLTLFCSLTTYNLILCQNDQILKNQLSALLGHHILLAVN